MELPAQTNRAMHTAPHKMAKTAVSEWFVFVYRSPKNIDAQKNSRENTVRTIAMNIFGSIIESRR
jgi:hypothetical protein